jgi:hypothetical protein
MKNAKTLAEHAPPLFHFAFSIFNFVPCFPPADPLSLCQAKPGMGMSGFDRDVR